MKKLKAVKLLYQFLVNFALKKVNLGAQYMSISIPIYAAVNPKCNACCGVEKEWEFILIHHVTVSRKKRLTSIPKITIHSASASELLVKDYKLRILQTDAILLKTPVSFAAMASQLVKCMKDLTQRHAPAIQRGNVV
jgi:hypothetical protein